MKKINFINKPFYWILLAFLGLLLMWNTYSLILTRKLFGVFPVIIQLVLIVLILIKHEYAKIGIKIWSLVFLIIAPGLVLLGIILKLFASSNEEISTNAIIFDGITIIAGILIFSYTNDSIQYEELESNNAHEVSK